MDVRRLRMLLELARLGSMHEVADALGTTTSSVSQGIAALARDVRTPLVEPDGRRVRLTPAGRRLADHAVTILAAVESARLDLDPGAEPVGVLRVAGFASAIRPRSCPRSTTSAPPTPASTSVSSSTSRSSRSTCSRATRSTWPSSTTTTSRPRSGATTTRSRRCGRASGESACRRATAGWRMADLADRDWIVNSRHFADERALRSLAARAGFAPRVVHRIDSLELVDDLIVAGRGVGPAAPRARVAARGERACGWATAACTCGRTPSPAAGATAGRRCGRWCSGCRVVSGGRGRLSAPGCCRARPRGGPSR